MVKYAIAQKLQATTSNPLISGYITPYVIEEGGERIIAEDSDFPNWGKIFIPNSYNEIEKFDEDSLFRISFAENQLSAMNEDRPNNCRYKASGRDAKQLNRYEYFHVVEKRFDPANLLLSLNIKPSRCIFIHDSEEKYIYGPFEIETYDVDQGPYAYKARVKPLESQKYFNAPPYCVMRISDDKFTILDIGAEKILITDLNAIQEQIPKPLYIDCITDEQLIKWGDSHIERPDAKLKKDFLHSFRAAIERINETDEIFFNNRYQRLQRLIARTDTWLTYRSTFISDYLKTKAGNEEVNRYLDSNKNSYLDYALKKYDEEARQRYNYDLKSEEYYQELDNLQKDIRVKQDEKKRIEEELKQTAEELKRRKEKDIEAELFEQQKKIADVQLEIEKRQNELEEITKQLGLAKDIGQLKIELGILQRQEAGLQESLAKSQEAVTSTKSTFQRLLAEEGRDLHRRLLEAKSVLDALESSAEGEAILDEPVAPPSTNKKAAPKLAKDFVYEVQSILRNHGRDLPEEIVANYLITIHQSFLTIFAGLPGTGKTSLVSLLAKSLGISAASRFIDIRTSRGWTSQRDILGFYNPLNHRFQESATGLYKALRACTQT